MKLMKKAVRINLRRDTNQCSSYLLVYFKSFKIIFQNYLIIYKFIESEDLKFPEELKYPDWDTLIAKENWGHYNLNILKVRKNVQIVFVFAK